MRAPYLPEVPALPAAGVPSELVQRRPDLRSAEARLCGADDRAYEARALLYPRLTLSGSGGRTSSELNDLLDADFDVWSLLAGIAQPLFQGGKMRAGVELAEARAREAAANFGAAVLRAFVEVETHLAVEGALERREVEQARATASAKSARDLAAERYAAGRDELTTLLDAQRRALASESELLAVRFLRLESRVDLYLALGGGLATAPESTEESE